MTGDAQTARDLLGVVGTFAGSPAARWASAAEVAVASCPGQFSARNPDPAELPGSVACNAMDPLVAPLEAWRDEGSLALTHTSKAVGRISARVFRQGHDGYRVEGHLAGDLPDGAWSLLDPAAESAGPGVLASDGALFQARLRTHEGLDLASIVAQGAELDRMVKLRSKVFEGAVLDGTWEAAVYTPDPGQQMMPVVLVLGTQHGGAAVEGMETFIDELLTEWPIHRTDHTTAGHEGACLADLNVLPEFAPCYVATEEALVLGWNARGLELALAPDGEPWQGKRDGVVVHMDRFAEADQRLVSRLLHHEPEPEVGEVAEGGGNAVPYPADRIQLELWRDGQTIRFALTVEGAVGR